MKRAIVILSILYTGFFCQGQNTDSLYSIWNDVALHDTVKLEAMNRMVKSFMFHNPDSARNLSLLQSELAKKSGKKWEAHALNNRGITYAVQGDRKEALKCFLKTTSLYEQANYVKGLGRSYNNLGISYKNLGDLNRALDYQLKGLTINERMQDTSAIGLSYQNIGGIHVRMRENDQALDYFMKALEMMQMVNNKRGMINITNNIGVMYQRKQMFDLAMEYYHKSLEIEKEVLGENHSSSVYMNMGIVAKEQGEYDQAMEYYELGLKLAQKQNEKQGIASVYGNMGVIEYKRGKYALAEEYCKESLKLGEELESVSQIKHACFCLYQAMEGAGRHKEALEYHKRYIAAKDSVENERNTKMITQREMQYDFDKQQLADSLDFAKAQELKDLQLSEQKAQLDKEKIMKYGLFGGLSLVLLFAVFIFNRFRVTQKQKKVIEQQKELVENQKDIVDEKNKEILDSIQYAKRIQSAILPPQKLVKQYLQDSFILFKPKDIVAGDFYWMEVVDDLIFFSAADCTGHGVPGAMVSVMCSHALTKAVTELKLKEPAKILDAAVELLQERFARSEEEMKDGMDLALCTLNLQSNVLQYAGANNALYHISDGELVEIKADKQPVGQYDHRKPFTNHTVSLKAGDCVYLFTDGYADQFGGDRGKKLKYKAFKQLLLDNQDKPMEQQREILDRTFEEWRSDLEQIDDVCIIGVKL